MIIDFHNHYYPPEYLDALRKGPTAVQLSTDDEGNPVIGYPGDYNVAVGAGSVQINSRPHSIQTVVFSR